VTENNPSDTPGKTFNTDASAIHIHNKPDCVIIENISKNFIYKIGRRD
jgi:hypothetical protein